MATLTLAQASTIVDVALKTAREKNFQPLTVAVLDPGGHLVAFKREDKSGILRYDIAYGKAFAALSLNRSSRQVLQKFREKPYFMDNLVELSDGPLFFEGGGQLIRDPNGEIAGALGVTGDVNEVDDLCGIDGIHAGGFNADSDFTAAEAKRLNIKVDPSLDLFAEINRLKKEKNAVILEIGRAHV